jgi:hypothetical protein
MHSFTFISPWECDASVLMVRKNDGRALLRTQGDWSQPGLKGPLRRGLLRFVV